MDVPQTEGVLFDLQSVDAVVLEQGDADLDLSGLFGQVVIDKGALLGNIESALSRHSQVALAELVRAHPLQNGLAELVAYMQLAAEWPRVLVDENVSDLVEWDGRNGMKRHTCAARD